MAKNRQRAKAADPETPDPGEGPALPPEPPGDALAKFRTRITRFEPAVPAQFVHANPKNWRTHPEYQQSAMRAILDRIGFVGAVIVRELDDPPGHYELLDGHLRLDLSDGAPVPCLVTDLTAAEADEVLATFDAVTSLAVPDQDKLGTLLRDLKGLDVPLVEMGWPEFRLEAALGAGWVPPRATQAAAGPAEEVPENAAGAGYKVFTVPLTIGEEKAVRDAIKEAKAVFAVESSGAALAALAEAWRAARGGA